MRKFTKQILASVLSLAMVVSSASGIGIASVKKTANAEEASATATAAPNNIGEERTLPSGFVTRDNGIMRDNMDSAAYRRFSHLYSSLNKKGNRKRFPLNNHWQFA